MFVTELGTVPEARMRQDAGGESLYVYNYTITSGILIHGHFRSFGSVSVFFLLNFDASVS